MSLVNLRGLNFDKCLSLDEKGLSKKFECCLISKEDETDTFVAAKASQAQV